METIADTWKRYGYSVPSSSVKEKNTEVAFLVRMIEELREKLSEALTDKQKLQRKNDALKMIIPYAWEDGLSSAMALYTDERKPDKRTDAELVKAYKSAFMKTLKQVL